MNCWKRDETPVDDVDEDMLRWRNWCTLGPKALTMWLGRPRDCSSSVRRLSSVVAVVAAATASVSEESPESARV